MERHSCEECGYRTGRMSGLERHVKTRRLDGPVLKTTLVPSFLLSRDE